MLDGLYLQLSPGTFVHEDAIGDHTIDDLLTVRPGGSSASRAASPDPGTAQRHVRHGLQAIEFKIRQRESRTGITRLNKGVDEDTLNDTAKGQAQLMSRGQQMERYIIRNFAEGVRPAVHEEGRLMRKHGAAVPDPRGWAISPGRSVAMARGHGGQVKVGLGSGSKEDRIMGRQMIGQVQAMLKQAGSPIVTDDNLYNNALAWRATSAFSRTTCSPSRPRTSRATRSRAAAARSQGAGADGSGSGQAAGDRGAARGRRDEAPADAAAARDMPSWRSCASIRRRQSPCASRTFRRSSTTSR
jgi:hypothetical protein